MIFAAPNVWLHSSVGIALHRYRGGHGFESRWSSDFFQASSFQLLKLENLLRWSHFTFLPSLNCLLSSYNLLPSKRRARLSSLKLMKTLENLSEPVEYKLSLQKFLVPLLSTMSLDLYITSVSSSYETEQEVFYFLFHTILISSNKR